MHPITMILGRELLAADGAAGKVEDVYFSEGDWKIRYLVVSAGSWANKRRFLISPSAITPGGWKADKKMLPARLTKDQLRGSPDLGDDVPRREQEKQLHDYYNWAYYWSETGPAGLHSLRRAIGYHLQARDGEIGHVENFIFDEHDWTVRYAQVDTSNLPGGKRVLLAAAWLTGISWDRKKVQVDIGREIIRGSPEYHPDELNRDYEARLYDYHRRPGYWRAA